METHQHGLRLLQDQKDQRRGRRFPIREPMHYVILGANPTILGKGNTLNISSTGIQFTTEDRIPIGCSVEVSMDWPATIDGCALKFVARGEVVRSADNWAAMKIERHEFRTRSTRLTAVDLGGQTCESAYADRP
jgi:hypothetical protein